jgi:hypothetical protein
MDVVQFMEDLTNHHVLAWKAALGTTIVALASLQVALGATFWTDRGLPIASPRAATLHRWNGRLLLVLSLVIGYACLMGPAGPTSPVRLLLHSVFGATLFALIFAKLLTLRVIDTSGSAVPVIGVALFLNYLVIWLTSVADYVLDDATDPPPGGALQAWAAVMGLVAAGFGGVGIAAFFRDRGPAAKGKRPARSRA